MNTDRKTIAKNIIKLKVIPAKTDEDKLLNHLAEHSAYVVRSGERLDVVDKFFLIDHPETFLLDDSQYRIVKANSLRYDVYIRNQPRARFYRQDKAREYVLLLMELI